MTAPEMGLPTPEDDDKTSTFAQLKEKARLHRLKTDKPNFMYLFELMSNCVRCLNVDVPYNQAEGHPKTPYQLDQTKFEFNEHERVLFAPDPEFLSKVFEAATKPRSVVALARAYMHVNYHDQEGAGKLWELVKAGLEVNDHDKLRPFLVLFQHMLEA